MFGSITEPSLAFRNAVFFCPHPLYETLSLLFSGVIGCFIVALFCADVYSRFSVFFVCLPKFGLSKSDISWSESELPSCVYEHFQRRAGASCLPLWTPVFVWRPASEAVFLFFMLCALLLLACRLGSLLESRPFVCSFHVSPFTLALTFPAVFFFFLNSSAAQSGFYLDSWRRFFFPFPVVPVIGTLLFLWTLCIIHTCWRSHTFVCARPCRSGSFSVPPVRFLLSSLVVVWCVLLLPVHLSACLAEWVCCLFVGHGSAACLPALGSLGGPLFWPRLWTILSPISWLGPIIQDAFAAGSLLALRFSLELTLVAFSFVLVLLFVCAPKFNPFISK